MSVENAVEIVAKVAASATLDDINRIVGQNEEIIGPLTNIGNEKGMTTLNFAVGDAPAARATIRPDKEGKPDLPDEAKLIDTDLIFVVGTLTLCSASRA